MLWEGMSARGVAVARTMPELLAATLVLLSCGTVPARIERDAAIRSSEEPRLLVVTEYQRSRIRRALEEAGLETVDEVSEASHILRVDIGVVKQSRSCGTLNNVRYGVHVDGVAILEIVARGWTESCEPNVFDEMSRLLAATLPADVDTFQDDVRTEGR